ncbi:Uncharacterized protein DAT39_012304, partial [Clarias magur]
FFAPPRLRPGGSGLGHSSKLSRTRFYSSSHREGNGFDSPLHHDFTFHSTAPCVSHDFIELFLLC